MVVVYWIVEKFIEEYRLRLVVRKLFIGVLRKFSSRLLVLGVVEFIEKLFMEMLMKLVMGEFFWDFFS